MGRRLLSGLLGGACVYASAAAFAGSPSAAGNNAKFTVHEDLAFKPDAGLTMDLFIPASSPKPIPCVMVIQGGGFRAQDGKRFRPFAVYLAENGFAAALISYRGTPKHTSEETLADVRDAIHYVRKHAAKYGIDPKRIGAMGRSAGGTLAALLAVTKDPAVTNEATKEYAHPIQAAVGLAGVYNFISRFTDKDQLPMQTQREKKLKTNGQWIGEPFSATSKRWQEVSAVTHVDRTDPPMLLLHCKDDPTVPWQQSREMYLKMKEAGIDSELQLYETGGHSCMSKESPPPMELMVTFFRKTLAQ